MYLSHTNKANQGRPGYHEDPIWPEFYSILPLPTSRNIVVWTPLPGTRVVNSQRIDGQARAFEANLEHQLKIQVNFGFTQEALKMGVSKTW